MDIRTYTREMADRRFAALETLRTIIEWLNATKPTQFFEPTAKGAPPVIEESQMRDIWRRWIDAYTDIFEKTRDIPDLLIEDIKKLYGSKEGTSEGK